MDEKKALAAMKLIDKGLRDLRAALAGSMRREAAKKAWRTMRKNKKVPKKKRSG